MSFFKIISSLYREGGIKNFYSGIGFVASACVPAHAAYFSTYEFSRKFYGVNDDKQHPYLFALIGVIATFYHDLIMTPLDVLKQRKQMTHSPTT